MYLVGKTLQFNNAINLDGSIIDLKPENGMYTTFLPHNWLHKFLETKLDIFAGGYAASNVFLLVCVPLCGFHTLVSYEWITEE